RAGSESVSADRPARARVPSAPPANTAASSRRSKAMTQSIASPDSGDEPAGVSPVFRVLVAETVKQGALFDPDAVEDRRDNAAVEDGDRRDVRERQRYPEERQQKARVGGMAQYLVRPGAHHVVVLLEVDDRLEVAAQRADCPQSQRDTAPRDRHSDGDPQRPMKRKIERGRVLGEYSGREPADPATRPDHQQTAPLASDGAFGAATLGKAQRELSSQPDDDRYQDQHAHDAMLGEQNRRR